MSFWRLAESCFTVENNNFTVSLLMFCVKKKLWTLMNKKYRNNYKQNAVRKICTFESICIPAVCSFCAITEPAVAHVSFVYRISRWYQLYLHFRLLKQDWQFSRNAEIWCQFKQYLSWEEKYFCKQMTLSTCVYLCCEDE